MSNAGIQIKSCTNFPIAVLYLEQEFGKEWFNHIELDKLDMEDANFCVVGQLTKVRNPDSNCIVFFIKKCGDTKSYSDTVFDSAAIAGSVYYNREALTKRWTEIIQALKDDFKRKAAKQKNDTSHRDRLRVLASESRVNRCAQVFNEILMPLMEERARKGKLCAEVADDLFVDKKPTSEDLVAYLKDRGFAVTKSIPPGSSLISYSISWA